MKKGDSIEQVIQKGRRSRLAQRVALLKESLQSEMNDIHNYLEDHGDAFYFYDSLITNKGFLRRISSWSLPNRRFYLIDGASNRTFTIYLIQQLQAYSYEEVYYESSRYPIDQNLLDKLKNVDKRRRKVY